MPRLTDAARSAAIKAKAVLSYDLIKVSLGCSNADLTDQAACELEGEYWLDDIYMTSYGSDVTADVGNGEEVFYSSEDLLGTSDVEETLSMDLATVSLTLSAISNNWLEKSQSMELNNRAVEMWRQLLDPVTREKIGLPFKYFSGVIVGGDIAKSTIEGGSSVELKASNEYYNFQVLSGFRANVDDHQKFFPNDTGFKNTSAISKNVPWGSE